MCIRDSFGKAQATATVDGAVAAEGVLTYGMMKTSLAEAEV